MNPLFPERTSLLATVLSAEEALAAVAAGAGVIDVKNPSEGALGAPVPSVIAAVRGATPDHIHVSAALGDMPFLPGTAALAAVGAASAGASIVKVGLYGPSNPEEAFLLLEVTAGGLRNSFPETVLVAGAYADAPRFGGIDPLAVPECAARAGASGCLLDTFDKSPGHTLPDILPLDAIEFFIRSCRENGLFSAIAGSLGTTETALLLPLRPDYLGYRGALCENGRTGKLSGEKVRKISLAITEGSR
jgi:(5-formylfuran-3-yl)methyl phosphate synthase